MTQRKQTPAERLAQLIGLHQHDRRVADLAQAGGLSEATVRNVLHARQDSYSDRTLRGLGVGFGIDLEEIYAAVGRPMPAMRLVGAERLNARARAQVQALILDLLDRQDARP